MLRRPLSLLLAVLLLAAPVRATWSILVLDTRTGEIVIASATCVDNSDLLNWTPVVIPGVGVAVCQAASPTDLKVLIHERMLLGHSPERIKTRIDKKYGTVGSFQYAILDMQGRSLLFTGGTNGAWAGGVTGQDGDLIYAIQGNVLAGAAVVDEAERAFLQTGGDLGQRVMAAMEAAMVQGGDGRCSCSIRFPDSCGTPPPNFNQTATIGYFIVSRPGDTSGACSVSGGCANGSYYLVLNEPNHVFPSTDPVILLRQQYDAWRASEASRPDAFQSLVIASTNRVPAEANALVDYWVELYDVDGVGLTSGGATVSMRHLDGSSGQAMLENVIDHQDGSYTLQVRSGTQQGLDRFAFVVDHGSRSVQLGNTQGLLHDPGPPLPINEPKVITAMGGAQVRDAQVVQDGAAVWFVGDAGSGWELLRSERTLTGDYPSPVAVTIDTVASGSLRTLWVSEDELHAVVSLLDPDGIERLYATERTDTQSIFGAPDKLGPLDEGAGASAPSLSEDRCTIYYESTQAGTRRVYRATRLDTEASWFPGEVVETLIGGVDEGSPELLDGGNLLAYDRRGNAQPRLHLARRDPEGSWQPLGPIAGAHGLQNEIALLAGWSKTQGEAWTLSRASSFLPAELRRYAIASYSLRVNPQEFSLSAGGVLQFDIDAGPNQALGFYDMWLGDAGSGLDLGSLVLPLRHQPGLTTRFRQIVSSGSAPDLQGQLDANGRKVALWNLPANPPVQAGLVGTTLHFACFALNAQGEAYATEAAPLLLLP